MKSPADENNRPTAVRPVPEPNTPGAPSAAAARACWLTLAAAVLGWMFDGLEMGFFDKSYAKAGAAIVFVYVIGMVLIWFAPETKDRPLPE